MVKIFPVDERIIELGLASTFKDFEDLIQYYVALENGIKIIITRNTEDYKNRKISVFTPEEYISSLG